MREARLTVWRRVRVWCVSMCAVGGVAAGGCGVVEGVVRRSWVGGERGVRAGAAVVVGEVVGVGGRQSRAGGGVSRVGCVRWCAWELRVCWSRGWLAGGCVRVWVGRGVGVSVRSAGWG